MSFLLCWEGEACSRGKAADSVEATCAWRAVDQPARWREPCTCSGASWETAEAWGESGWWDWEVLPVGRLAVFSLLLYGSLVPCTFFSPFLG